MTCATLDAWCETRQSYMTAALTVMKHGVCAHAPWGVPVCVKGVGL